MRKKNGFTLTELLVVIAMIAVVGTVIIVNTIAINNRAKDSEYDRMVEMVKNATKTYVSLYPNDFADLYSSKAFTYVSLKGVVTAGLLDEETKNPYTKENLDIDDPYMGFVKVYVDGDSYEMVYKYPLTDEDYNTQIWLQTTTIIGNEDEEKGFLPINAFEGIAPNTKLATIDFAFSNESGHLVNANDPVTDKDYNSLLDKYRKKYNITFDMPSSFNVCTATTEICTSQDWYTNMPNGAQLSDYYVPTKTGTFEIKYNWSYESNGKTIYRTDTRIVRIISQTEREKNKISTGATTTSEVTTTADENGIIARYDNFEFKGDQPLNTGLQLLREDLYGKRHAFSILIQGNIDPASKKNFRLIDFIDPSDSSGFVMLYRSSIDNFQLNGYQIGGGGTASTPIYWWEGTIPFPYTAGNTFRLLLYFDPDISENRLFYEFTSNINDTKFTEDKKLTSGTGAYNDNIWWIRNSNNAELCIGGARNKTENYTGKLEKIIIFNKADPEFIYKDF